MATSKIEALMAKRAGDRLAEASSRALAGLDALADAGFRAWVFGSLAAGRFRTHSDVNFLVECDRGSKHEAFRILEQKMRGFPFHFFAASELDEQTRRELMRGAADASGIRAYAHSPG